MLSFQLLNYALSSLLYVLSSLAQKRKGNIIQELSIVTGHWFWICHWPGKTQSRSLLMHTISAKIYTGLQLKRLAEYLAHHLFSFYKSCYKQKQHLSEMKTVWTCGCAVDKLGLGACSHCCFVTLRPLTVKYIYRLQFISK